MRELDSDNFNFHSKFLRVHITLNRSQDDMWHFLLVYVETDHDVGFLLLSGVYSNGAHVSLFV